MLKMSHQFEDYQNNRTMTTSPSSDGCSVDWTAHSKGERESIHSGQFMVSHFEAEEAQDDLDDDGEIKMLDPEDPSLSKADEPNVCTEVQLYVPRKVTSLHVGEPLVGHVTSHLEIETSLTKLFKCMNLAYSQKLTSPKWNHFKGVRLRWKDKIRLNNVIWRCWHMQFIQKRKTPVCQFASPLDVDIHSNPQSVVLEGKYWKRQLVVIKAEYRKWRRNFKSNAIGCLTYDNKSELDFLEWSPMNDRGFVLSSEDWTSDTLFSAINGPFPFPDPREIARGAGIADFIQPSLGPLQPNLDDIDFPFAELLQNQRLPPVPEEAADEMLKSADYALSDILGSDQIVSNNIMDVGSGSVDAMQNDPDTNMMELNTPICAVPYSEIEQQFAAARAGNSNIPSSILASQSVNAEMLAANAMMTDERSSVLMSDAAIKSNNRLAIKQNNNTAEMLHSRQMAEFSTKSVIKGRISKTPQRPFRREPHNYDKAQPTLHQTTIYQQMLAEQQLQQAQIQQNMPQQTSAFAQQQQQSQAQQLQTQQQQQQQMQYVNTQFVQPLMCSNSNNNNNNNNYGVFNLTNASTLSMGVSNNIGNMLNSAAEMVATSKNYGLAVTNVSVPVSQAQSLMLNVKLEAPSADVLSMYNLSTSDTNSFLNSNNNSSIISTSAVVAANSYKPYSGIQNFKKAASVGNYINMRSTTVASQPTNFPHDQTQNSLNVHTHAQSLPLGLSGQLVTTIANSNVLQQQQQPQQQQHQQQQSQQQRLPYTQVSTSSHQTQQQAQQQLKVQVSQPLTSPQAQHNTGTGGLVPTKEMFRSNSLPLNVSFQKLDTRASHENFAIPKHHVKGNKSRSRSNSIHHQHAVPVVNNANSANWQLTKQLQAATSDPMINSTLAQLLTTTNPRISSLGKQQSSSTSAISNLNIAMPANAASNSNRCVLQSQSVAGPTPNNIYMSPTQSSSSSSSSPIVGTTIQGNQALSSTSEIMKRQHLHVPKSPKKSTSLPAPVTQQMVHSPQGNKMMSFPPTVDTQNTVACTSTQLSLSPESFHELDSSPLSPTHNAKFPRDSQRRAGHIHAEQKRRYNIKNGFDMLHSLIPQLQQNPNAKLSKAAMLQKAAEYIKHLRTERNQLNDNMDQLRKERDTLNNSLMHLHSKLPANGAPVTRQGTEHVRQLYEQYVLFRTMGNWKFWILGLILEPLLSSYTASVSSANNEELRRTAFLWIDQHCSLIDLRPAVSNKLKYLSMKTDILSDPPSTLQEEVTKAVHNTAGQHPNLNGT